MLFMPCREEYLAESAARMAAAAGEVTDVEQHAQRTKAPLAQAAGGAGAAAGGRLRAHARWW